MGWQIISHLSPKIQWVVQVKQGTGVYQSEGFLSRLTLEKVASEPTRKHKALFQFPSGGRSISITTSTQPAFATTYTHVFSMATSIVARKMKSQAQRLGWQLQDETKQNRTMIQRFSQSGKTLDLAIVPVNSGKSWVFANEVKRDDQ